MLEVPPLFQETHGTHKVIPQWLTERFSGSSLVPRIFGSKGSQRPSILGSTQWPSSQFPIRSIRSPIVSYIVPPSRRTSTLRPSNSVYSENDRTSSPFLYDLVDTEKGKSTSVKDVEKTIVEVKILKSNIAGGRKRVCASPRWTQILANVVFSTEPQLQQSNHDKERRKNPSTFFNGLIFQCHSHLEIFDQSLTNLIVFSQCVG